jgi:hypothetical protein
MMDGGLLLVRVVVGLLLAGHGTHKLFGWFGGHGLDAPPGFWSRWAGGPAAASRRGAGPRRSRPVQRRPAGRLDAGRGDWGQW